MTLQPGQKVQPNPDSPFHTKWEGQTEGVIYMIYPGEDPWVQHAYCVQLPNGLYRRFEPDELEEVTE